MFKIKCKTMEREVSIMKKLLSILLALAITLGIPVSALADENSVNEIRSLEIQSELIEYATNIFPKHLHALVEAGDLNGSIEDYSFGEPFTIFNVEEYTNSSCLPVLQNGSIVAILEVSENQGEYNSSLSVSFAKELEDILNSNTMSGFVLLTDGVNLL